MLTTLAHEGLGHGGMCVAVGGHPQAWGAYYFDCDTSRLPAWAGRAVAAAGSTVNLILCLFYSLLRGGDQRLYLGGLFPVFRRGGIGDWGEDGVLKGAGDALAVRVGA